MYDIGLVEAEVGFDGMRGKEKLPVAIQDHQEPVQSLERQPITDSNEKVLEMREKNIS